ncbi:TRAP transporter small permease [Neptunicoccus cionae]|uniref:TRAP transporter small permease n=1 Tax=Neptunicoccus cionae TaxID=2035344 RepID=UPI000C77869F|nr:TRAP transporter small permease [Amylibacter cionae]PLS21077.1 C4-dicarboxylate ABC transporter permease [Amylibacter cionae]
MSRLTPIPLIHTISAVILGVLVVGVFINVVMRFGFNSGFVMTEEISRILLVWLVFLAAIVVLARGQHIMMTMAVERLPQTSAKVLAVIGAALMIFCDVLLCLGAWQQLKFSLTDYLPVSGLPLAVVFAPGVFAACAFAVITACRAIALLRGTMTTDAYFGITSENPELH